MNGSLINNENIAYTYNKSIVNKIIEISFSLISKNQISEIEKKLINAFELSLRETGLQIIGSILSFGSTARNTYIENDFDIDIAANLKLDSAQNLTANTEFQERLKQSIKRNLRRKNLKYGEFSDSGKVRDRPFYKFALERIVSENCSLEIKKVDFVLNFIPYANIGLINQRILTRQFSKIEKDLGSLAKNKLLAQIRFTKWLFQQELRIVDSFGRNIEAKEFEKIGAKRGLRSIHIEQIILQLSQEDNTGRFTQIGSFDTLMELVYNVDLSYRKSLPITQKDKIIPLEQARNIPALKRINRSEAIQELAKINHTKILLDYISSMNESIFDDFRSTSKWNLLVRIARDYFEEIDFAENYLQSFNSISLNSN